MRHVEVGCATGRARVPDTATVIVAPLSSLLPKKYLHTLIPAGKRHRVSMEAIEENLMKRLFIKV